MAKGRALDKNALAFLTKELPEIDEASLTDAFSRVFSREFREGIHDASAGRRDANLVELAVNALSKAMGRIDGLPPGVRARLDGDQGRNVRGIAEVHSFLATEWELLRIYHRSRPETGGRNWLAYEVADAVHLALSDLGIKPTFGTRGDDSTVPSTAFGRIVKQALAFHKIDADWRAPAKNTFQEYRQDSSI